MYILLLQIQAFKSFLNISYKFTTHTASEIFSFYYNFAQFTFTAHMKKPPKASRQTRHEQHARSTIIGSAKGYKMKFLKITILLPIKEDIPLIEHLRC